MQLLKTAYGQLVLIVFLPIAILASVGAALVFLETTRTVKSEQDTLAQAALIRYEPIVRPLMPSLSSSDYNKLAERIREMGANGMTGALTPEGEKPYTTARRYLTNQLYRIQGEQHVKRVALLDGQGNLLLAVGYQADVPYPAFDTHQQAVWRLPTAVGMAYGMPIYGTVDGTQKRFWVMVDMDNEPLTIAYYRIVLALLVTGLTTLLLLLFSLNVYSKRFISPIYDMRLFLQRVNSDNLGRKLVSKTQGEFYLLQKELNFTLRRLGKDFRELKDYSRQTQTDLHTALDEMEMQNISMRRAHEEALQASRIKSAFLANISHELRTPLNAIDGFINLLAQQDLGDKENLYVQTIKKSSAHLLALIGDVLDFSKLEAKKLTLTLAPFDLIELVYEVVDMLSPFAYDKNLRLAVVDYTQSVDQTAIDQVPERTVAGKLMLDSDRLRVKQVLTNLVGNAVKFTDTGSVDVVVTKIAQSVLIAVNDTGRGLDAAAKKQLFTSFGQGDVSITKRYGGTGLGLVISRELVQLMGGEMGFLDKTEQDEQASGAVFWVRLPFNVEKPLAKWHDDAPRSVLERALAPDVGVLEAAFYRMNHHQQIGADSADDIEKHSTEIDAKMGAKKTSAPLRPIILVRLTHAPALEALKIATARDFALVAAPSLAALLDALAAGSDARYHAVIIDSTGQHGDWAALIRQVRRVYAGKLLVYGYEVGQDGQALDDYGAAALYEPLSAAQLHPLLWRDVGEKMPARQARQRKRYHGKTALAVDDHLPNLLVLEALLGEFGVQVVSQSSGAAAVDYLTECCQLGRQLPDIIFMDIQMPVMSGLAAATAIRRILAARSVQTNKTAPHLPIIALSAHGVWDQMAALHKAGMDEYATKPIARETLGQLLEKWLPKNASDEEDDIGDVGKRSDGNKDNPAAYKLHNLHNLPNSRPIATQIANLATERANNDERAASAGGLNSTLGDVTSVAIDSRSKDSPLPVTDWQDAQARAGDNPKLAHKLFALLKTDLPNDRSNLATTWQAFVATGDDVPRAALHDAVHKLLGACRYTGVPALRAACQTFYDLLNNFDGAQADIITTAAAAPNATPSDLLGAALAACYEDLMEELARLLPVAGYVCNEGGAIDGEQAI